MMTQVRATIDRAILARAADAAAREYWKQAATKNSEQLQALAQRRHWLTRKPWGLEKAARSVGYGVNQPYVPEGRREESWAERARTLVEIGQTSHLTNITVTEYDISLLGPFLDEIEAQENA